MCGGGLNNAGMKVQDFGPPPLKQRSGCVESSAVRSSYSSAAQIVDAADGVMDGKYFEAGLFPSLFLFAVLTCRRNR